MLIEAISNMYLKEISGNNCLLNNKKDGCIIAHTNFYLIIVTLLSFFLILITQTFSALATDQDIFVDNVN